MQQTKQIRILNDATLDDIFEKCLDLLRHDDLVLTDKLGLIKMLEIEILKDHAIINDTL